MTASLWRSASRRHQSKSPTLRQLREGWATLKVNVRVNVRIKVEVKVEIKFKVKFQFQSGFGVASAFEEFQMGIPRSIETGIEWRESVGGADADD